MASLPPITDPEAPLRRALARHRAVATGLLVGMAALLLLAYRLPPGYWTDMLQAAAKAGVVGGIADWFAVTALFRHPLGLPIPHTAIIPNQKERLGQGLGRFVANHVFTEAEVRRVLGRLDLAGIFRSFMADPAAARPAAEAMAATLPRLLASSRMAAPAACWAGCCHAWRAGRAAPASWPGRCGRWSRAAGTTRSSTWRSPSSAPSWRPRRAS